MTTEERAINQSDTTVSELPPLPDLPQPGAPKKPAMKQPGGKSLRLPKFSGVGATQAAKKGLMVIVVALIGFGGGWLGAMVNTPEANSTTTESQRIVLDEQGNLISSIAKEVGESVVSVQVVSSSDVQSFWGSRSVEQESAGTGVILTEDGLILTNRHVVPTGNTSVGITLSDGTEFDAEVVARTSDSDTLDIAFLQAQDLGSRKLKPAKLGSSSDMRVGDSVIAIGNALGQFQNTVTTGILSGYGRSVQASSGSGTAVENLDDLFQTDASINSGNSGGPLVNVNGEVIGINTAVASDAENIGFAIPIDNIVGLISSVKETGTINRPFLGVVYVSLTDDMAKELDLSVTRGAYIPKSETYGQETIIADGAAAKAGVREGDVITKVGSTDINERTSLAAALNKYTAGSKTTLTVQRGSQTLTLDVTLSSRPD